MAYKIAFRNSFERDFKKLKPLIQNFVLDVADKIQERTLYGEQLKGSFQGFYKFPFGHKPEYQTEKIYTELFEVNLPMMQLTNFHDPPKKLQTATSYN